MTRALLSMAALSVWGGPALAGDVLGPFETPNPPVIDPDVGEPDKDEVLEADDDAPASADDGEAAGFLFAQPAAMTALGDGTGKFDEPGTPEDFAVAVGDFFTESGGLAAGGAVEVGARALGLTSRVTAARYRESWALRTLSHSYLSLATTTRTVPDEDDDVMMAVGLRSTLLHGGDALMQAAYAEAVDAVITGCLRESRAAEAKGETFDTNACMQEAYTTASADIPDPRWNAGGLVLSGAFTGGWLGGRYTGFQPEAVSGWVTGVTPLSTWGQVGLGLGWTQSFTDAPNVLAPTTRLRAGYKGARVTTELGARLALTEEGLSPSYRIILGGEARVQSQSWVHAEFGLDLSPERDEVTLLSSLSFRWGQADEPSFMDSNAADEPEEAPDDEGAEEPAPSAGPSAAPTGPRPGLTPAAPEPEATEPSGEPREPSPAPPQP